MNSCTCKDHLYIVTGSPTTGSHSAMASPHVYEEIPDQPSDMHIYEEIPALRREQDTSSVADTGQSPESEPPSSVCPEHTAVKMRRDFASQNMSARNRSQSLTCADSKDIYWEAYDEHPSSPPLHIRCGRTRSLTSPFERGWLGHDIPYPVSRMTPLQRLDPLEYWSEARHPLDVIYEQRRGSEPLPVSCKKAHQLHSGSPSRSPKCHNRQHSAPIDFLYPTNLGAGYCRRQRSVSLPKNFEPKVSFFLGESSVDQKASSPFLLRKKMTEADETWILPHRPRSVYNEDQERFYDCMEDNREMEINELIEKVCVQLSWVISFT